MSNNEKELSNITKEQEKQLLAGLKKRFEENMSRHIGVVWNDIKYRLETSPPKLIALQEMELSGGEPDVVVFDKDVDTYYFVDCVKESPSGRRSLCYDQDALEKRKKNKPHGSALSNANAMGIEILNEVQYRKLQTYGEFDTKTSSWIKTPEKIRHLGGALFCDRRYNCVFTYHNGADSYYGLRGFRGCLKV